MQSWSANTSYKPVTAIAEVNAQATLLSAVNVLSLASTTYLGHMLIGQ